MANTLLPSTGYFEYECICRYLVKHSKLKTVISHKPTKKTKKKNVSVRGKIFRDRNRRADDHMFKISTK